MTIVNYRLDEATLAEGLQHAPERTERCVLEQVFLVMPVRLSVSGVEMLELPNGVKRTVFIGAVGQSSQATQVPDEESCWLPLPLLGLATDASWAVNRIGPPGEQKVYLAGGGDLTFARRDCHRTCHLVFHRSCHLA